MWVTCDPHVAFPYPCHTVLTAQSVPGETSPEEFVDKKVIDSSNVLPKGIPHVVVVSHNIFSAELYKAMYSWNSDHCIMLIGKHRSLWSCPQNPIMGPIQVATHHMVWGEYLRFKIFRYVGGLRDKFVQILVQLSIGRYSGNYWCGGCVRLRQEKFEALSGQRSHRRRFKYKAEIQMKLTVHRVRIWYSWVRANTYSIPSLSRCWDWTLHTVVENTLSRPVIGDSSAFR